MLLQVVLQASRKFLEAEEPVIFDESLTPEAAQVSGIPYIMDAYREEAEKIINS